MRYTTKSAHATTSGMPVAIIGIAIRGPGDGSDPEQFWKLLLDARSARCEVPKDRYNINGFHHPDSDRLGSVQHRHAHFLKQDFKAFDAAFFSNTPKEAEAMDPIHRMLLEVTYEGFENAGLTLADISGTQTSCYVGTCGGSFTNPGGNEEPSTYHATGSSSSLASNRLSWFYDLHGPSMTIDTACSSSLVAFHLACQSIRTGEAEMSVVAGANLMLGPDMSLLLGAAKLLSPDGKSRMWDQGANGFARGEGFGVTILKSLDAALRDGDTIRAVVLASAANEDGWTPGISLPNSEAQQALIRKTYLAAGVDPAETGYVEAHGTGTQAGDPLEARAILKTIGDLPGRKSDLYVGSVKTNIGHLEGAAGVAGVVKAMLAVETGLIPQNLWFDKLNSRIDLPANVKIPTSLTEWPHSGPRRASINSFGFGGANAHVILEDAASYLARHRFEGRHATVIHSVGPNGTNGHPTNGGSNAGGKKKIFLLSSNDQHGVKRNSTRLQTYLSTRLSNSQICVNELSYTLSSKRTLLPWKSFAIASSISELAQSLESSPPVVRSSSSSVPRVAFVFTGQGAQYFQMGKGLSVYRAFSESIVRSEAILKSLGCPWSLIEELNRSEADCNLRLADYSQPTCTALQVALVDLLKDWSVQPNAVIGHSSGEIAAAYCAGFIDHEAAVQVAWFRGQVQTGSANGGMLAVSASTDAIQEQLQSLTRGKVVVGCLNSPKACTISGDRDAIEELQEILEAAHIPNTRLTTNAAYHSFHMEAAREKYETVLAGIPHKSSSNIPMFSSVTGKLVVDGQVGPAYWADNLVSPVNFAGAVRSLLHHTQENARSHDHSAFAGVFLELGPHSALRTYLLDTFAAEDRSVDLSYATIIRRKFDNVQTVLEAMGRLWAMGCAVDIDRVNEIPSTTKMLVDLPPYSWNHARIFWDEPHLSREYRLREKPRTDLLGYRIPGTPDPTWRNFLRCNESPWIREHKVQGDILYPAAGIVIMAIEAARQLAEDDGTETIHGYEVRDVVIDTALRVPDTDKGIEVMLQLHPRRTGTKAAPSTSLYEFSVSSGSGESKERSLHAWGLVSVSYESSLSSAMRLELALETQQYGQQIRDAKELCQRPAHRFLYDAAEAVGMQYGPIFRNVTELSAGPNASYGVISVPDTRSVMPMRFEYPCVVHPATLDSVLHLLFPSIGTEGQSLSEAVVPFSFDKIYISAKIPTAPGTKLYGCSTTERTSYTNWQSSITVSEDLSEPMIIVEGLSLVSVGDVGSQAAQENGASCFWQTWHEDIDLLEQSQIKDILYRRTGKSRYDDSVLDKVECFCLVYIHRCLAWFESQEGRPFLPQDGFWKLYVEWMYEMVKRSPPLPESDADLESIMVAAREEIALSESADITVQMVDRIGQNLRRIFTHEVESLQIMTQDDLLSSFYHSAFGSSCNRHVAEYVGLVADKSPGIRILEIGAGTGGTTYHVLERLRNPDGSSKAGQYCFTDISPGFLAKAAEKFSTDASIMEFTTLNIENEPTKQGFASESYDLIVCAFVLHATKSIQETLAHCKSLLKPGGRLVLSEQTINQIPTTFIMGSLPGWWLSEDDGRKGGPLLDVDGWTIALQQAGFSSLDVDISGNSQMSKEPVSLIISTKPEAELRGVSQFIVISMGTEASNDLSDAIQKSFKSAGHEIRTIQWTAVTEADVDGKHCLCMAEWEDPMLVSITDSNWERLRKVILGSNSTLWITSGAAMDCLQPLKSLMVGLARAICNENASVRLAVLDLDTPETINSGDAADCVLKVAVGHIRRTGSDGEYAARGRTLYVPRVERLLDVDASLRKYEAKDQPELLALKGCGRPLKLTIKTPGLLDTFRWEEDETFHQSMPEDWIEIEVKAVGLNFKDVLIALGKVPEHNLGLDTSGIVTRVGSAVVDFQPGDRVMTATRNAFATFARFPSKTAIAIPSGMTFEEAASMPIIYFTAYYALITAGRVVRGEKVLIHAAAGGVGQAAIKIAQHIGAEVFATVSSEAKKELIMQQYGIPESHIFNSRDTSFAKAVMRATDGQGVDAVLNSLAGEALRLSWYCLAKFGRFLEIGTSDLLANTGLDMKPFLDNKSYIGVNLADFVNDPRPRVLAVWEEMARWIHDVSMTPVAPIKQFTMTEVEKAFRFMQTGKHMGKIVVRVDDGDLVPVVPRAPQVNVDADSTYVVAGLGGICREIGRWLSEKGARHLALVSRHAASSEENKAFATDLRKTYNVEVFAYNCDIGDKAQLQSVLDDLEANSAPPIRGCVTGAMVLQDTLFENMTAAHVRTTIGPKVHGTWNLHELLPRDLDFFVMLSSIAGVVGHRGQGNYNCGNIFQDCLAAFRRSQDLRAMTIDISYLVSVGFVAEHKEYIDQIKAATGAKVMHTSDLHGLLSTALEDAVSYPPQIIIGLPYNRNDGEYYWIQDPRFAVLRNMAATSGPTRAATVSLRDELARCGRVGDEAVQLISSALVQRLAKLMMMPEDDIDAGRPLSAYGVDSLVAVEMRNWMVREVAVEVSLFDVTANIPLRQLAVNLAGKSELLAPESS